MTNRAEGASPEAQRPDPNFDYSSGAAFLRGEETRPPEYVEYLDKAVKAMRTVRVIVYAGMAGFIVLAIYGFVLILLLTRDVSRAVDQTELMTQQMQAMTRVMLNMEESVATIDNISSDMQAATQAINDMNQNVAQMSQAVSMMQHSASNLDQSFSPMMGVMNRFFPFGATGSNYYPASPYTQ